MPDAWRRLTLPFVTNWTVIFAIAIGGAAGALLRWGLALCVQQVSRSTFPYGTLVANLLGCLAIGFCYVWLAERGSPALRAGIRIGLLGALTTFSTYCMESYLLMESRDYLAAGMNLIGSVIAGMVAVIAGVALARTIGL